MKVDNITPVFKKDDRTNKTNYRPITSILPNMSKVSEISLCNQLYPFFDKILSIQQCGFRNGFSAQHCIIRLIEKWKQYLDQGWVFDVLLTDLSKAFYCRSHELLAKCICRLNTYGVETSANSELK